MSIDWTDAKTWQEKGPVAAELAAIHRRIEGYPVEAYGQAIPDVLDFLRLQRRGIGYLYDAVQKITRYNQAAHEQQGSHIEMMRTLVDAVREQDRRIRRLTKQVAGLEKRLMKVTAASAKKKVSR